MCACILCVYLHHGEIAGLFVVSAIQVTFILFCLRERCPDSRCCYCHTTILQYAGNPLLGLHMGTGRNCDHQRLKEWKQFSGLRPRISSPLPILLKTLFLLLSPTPKFWVGNRTSCSHIFESLIHCHIASSLQCFFYLFSLKNTLALADKTQLDNQGQSFHLKIP